MDRLEIFQQIRKTYGTSVANDLASVYFCQSDKEVLLEINFIDPEEDSVTFDLLRIGEYSDGGRGDDCISYFLLNYDIIDNIRILLGFHRTKLLNLFFDLFDQKLVHRYFDLRQVIANPMERQ
jgi:hypothetical protein